MEIIDIEQLMQQKYDECVAWLNGKDDAQARFEKAWLDYENAKKALDEYSDVQYVTKLTEYKDYLKSKLGIVDDGDEQVQEEQKIEDTIAPEEIASDIVEQPLI